MCKPNKCTFPWSLQLVVIPAWNKIISHPIHLHESVEFSINNNSQLKLSINNNNTYHLLGSDPRRRLSLSWMLRFAHSPLKFTRKHQRLCFRDNVGTELRLFFVALAALLVQYFFKCSSFFCQMRRWLMLWTFHLYTVLYFSRQNCFEIIFLFLALWTCF